MAIENTSKRDPALHLAVAMGNADGYISDMERAGQQQLLVSSMLPTNSHGSDEALIALGFELDAPDPNDRLFRSARLPKGWSREGGSHAMWSHLIDEHGRKRVAVFYKAAFYDRRADMRLVTPTSYLRGIADDGGKVVLDDVWLTAETARVELTALRAEAHATAGDYEQRGRTDDYWRDRAADYRKDVATFDRLLSEVGNA